MEIASITISILALLISVTTFWLTRLRKGLVRMTKPTVIFFGPDGQDSSSKKIFVRTLLYSTSDRGQYIENMYVKLTNSKLVHIFNIWVYGDNILSRGSGLFISKHGLAVNHHFLTPKDNTNLKFIEGKYQLDIFVEPVNSKPIKIYSQLLNISPKQANQLLKNNAGIYFDWAPEKQSYHSHIDSRPDKTPSIIEFMKGLET